MGSQSSPAALRAKRLWTFIVRGGEEFKVQPKGNFPMIHGGTMSVLKAVLTEEKANETKALFEEQYGCRVKMTTEWDEAPDERERLAGAMREEMVFPSEKCPTCIWFDLNTPNMCGIEDWDKVSIEQLTKRPKALDDLDQCPLQRGQEYL